VLDGTWDIGNDNFQKMKNFVVSFVDRMTIGLGDSRVGVLQFTPTARPEFYPLNYIKNDLVKEAVGRIPYTPCLGSRESCYGSNEDGRTLNYVAQFGLSPAAGNRPRIPDVMIILTDDHYQPKPYVVNETMFQPLSSLYVIAIRVGVNTEKLHLNIPFATKYEEMHVSNFNDLPSMVDPLCNEINTLISKGNFDLKYLSTEMQKILLTETDSTRRRRRPFRGCHS
jgi:collagen type VI alpha